MAELGHDQKTIAKGTFWGLAGSLGVRLAAIIYLMIVVRLFSQDAVGTFYLAVSIVSMTNVFKDLGLSSTLTRYIPFYRGRGEPKKESQMLFLSYILTGVVSVLTAVAVFFLSGPIAQFFQNPELSQMIRYLTIFIVVEAFFFLNVSFLSGAKRIKESNYLSNAQNVLKLILTVGLFLLVGADPLILSLALVGSYILSFLISIPHVRKEIKHPLRANLSTDYSQHMEMIGEMVPFGLSISLLLSLWVLVMYIDRIMLGYMLPPETSAATIAIYTIATSIASVIIIFPASVSSIFLPVISEMHGKEDEKGMLGISHSTLRWTLLLVSPATILFMVFPGELIALFYGAAYASGAAVLAIFSLGMFLRALSYPQNSALAARRQVKVEIYVAFAAAITNILLNMVLIPAYGMEGAALASCVSFLLATVLATMFSKKLMGFSFPAGFARTVFSFLFTLALFFAIRGPAIQLMDNIIHAIVQNPGLEGVLLNKLIQFISLSIFSLLIGGVFFISVRLFAGFEEEDKELLHAAMGRAKAPKFLFSVAERIMG